MIDNRPTQSSICGGHRQIATNCPMLDTSHWRSICDVTLTLKQAQKSVVPSNVPYIAREVWFPADELQCKKAFRHFMGRLNREVYGAAYRRHNKRLRVIPILEKSLAGRWHFHVAIEPPAHVDIAEFERLIRQCWSRIGWGYEQVLVRSHANVGWIDYMLKPSQKAGFEHYWDCIDWDAFHNQVVDA